MPQYPLILVRLGERSEALLPKLDPTLGYVKKHAHCSILASVSVLISTLVLALVDQDRLFSLKLLAFFYHDLLCTCEKPL